MRFMIAMLVAGICLGATLTAQTKDGSMKGAEPTAQAVTNQKSGSSMGASAQRGYSTKNSRPTRGVVINLNEFLATGKGTVNTAQANEAAQKGAVLALLSGTGRSARIFLVAKADGSSASADLAKLADGTVGVVGRTVTRNGYSMILADVIDVMK
jgi:hypothetical protein